MRNEEMKKQMKTESQIQRFTDFHERYHTTAHVRRFQEVLNGLHVTVHDGHHEDGEEG